MILVTNHGAVRELRLNRPPVNALNLELMAGLRQAVEAAPHDGVRALVLSGAPGRFSAGLDVPLLLGLDRATIAALWRELYGLLKALASSPIPIAAAITGHAPAGGTVLPLFCDWRVAAQGDFKLGLSEVQVGITLPPIILSALRRQVGPRQAERLAVMGLLISPQEALDIGLVDEVVTVERVVGRALEWCDAVLALPAEAMTVTRWNARADLVGLFDNVERELAAVTEGWWNPQTQLALRAMVERLGKKAG
jgi:Delta3-Delta2-enoyl-CoA isomerase